MVCCEENSINILNQQMAIIKFWIPEYKMDNSILDDFIYNVTEEFEDTKGVIRICKLKKNRQHNVQKKRYKKTNKDLQNIQIKLKIE